MEPPISEYLVAGVNCSSFKAISNARVDNRQVLRVDAKPLAGIGRRMRPLPLSVELLDTTYGGSAPVENRLGVTEVDREGMPRSGGYSFPPPPPPGF